MRRQQAVVPSFHAGELFDAIFRKSLSVCLKASIMLVFISLSKFSDSEFRRELWKFLSTIS